MRKGQKERIRKLMLQARLLAEEALEIFEESDSTDGDLEHELHELKNAAGHIEDLMNGSAKHTKMGCA